MPISSFKDLKQVYDNINFPTVEHLEQLYQPLKESLKYGEYDLESIIYRFIDDQLAAVIITVKGDTNSLGVINLLQETYGEGEPVKHDVKSGSIINLLPQTHRKGGQDKIVWHIIDGYSWNGEKVKMYCWPLNLHAVQIIISCKKYLVKYIYK